MTAPSAGVEAVVDGDPAPPEAGPASGRWTPRRRLLVLAGIALAGFAIRLVMIFAVHPLCEFDPEAWNRGVADARATIQFPDQATTGCFPLVGDALYLYLQGRMVSDGQGFDDPIRYLTDGTNHPSAWKPPGVPALVAVLADVGLTSPDATRVASALMGAGTVFLLGLVTWRLGGARAGIAAAVIAAVHPTFVTNDWKLLTETPFALGMALLLLLAYRLWERPTVWRAVAVGAVVGALSYVRYEAPLLLLFVVLPLGLGMRSLRIADRIRVLVTVGLVALVLWAPLVLASQIRMQEPGLVGTGAGWGLLNGSCNSTWYGERIGTLDFNCFDLASNLEAQAVGFDASGDADETGVDAVYRRRALTYVEANLPRAPFVGAVRTARLWGLWNPAQTADIDASLEGRGGWESWGSLVALYATVAFSVVGLVSMRRRRVPISPVIGLVVLVSLLAAGSFALTRYRLGAEVALVVAAGVGIDVAWRALRRRLAPEGAGADVGPTDVAPAVERRSRSLLALPPVPVPRWTLPVAVVVAVALLAVVAVSSRVTPQPVEATSPPVCAQLVTFRGLLTDATPDAQQIPDILRILATIQATGATTDPEVAGAAADIQRFLFDLAKVGDPLRAISQAGPEGVAPAVHGLDVFTAHTPDAC